MGKVGKYLNVDKNMADNPKLLNSKNQLDTVAIRLKTEISYTSAPPTADNWAGLINIRVRSQLRRWPARERDLAIPYFFLRNERLIKQSQFFIVLIVRQW